MQSDNIVVHMLHRTLAGSCNLEAKAKEASFYSTIF